MIIYFFFWNQTIWLYFLSYIDRSSLFSSMSLFKASWVVLKIHQSREKNILYTIFSDAYGKIMCSKKYSAKDKPIDIGYVIQFEISTQQQREIHTIRNVALLSSYDSSNKSFDQIHSYLECIAWIDRNTATGIENRELFSIIPHIHSIQTHPEIRSKIVLSMLKVSQLLWNLPDTHQDPTVSKILRFIHANNTATIIKLSGISDDVLSALKWHISI